MNARVFMVLVFSSIFMGIWNSDQKAMDSTIAKNKRLNKSVAAFPILSVETVRRENTLTLRLPVPEPRPVRVAMRSNDHVGQSEPVIERHEEQVSLNTPEAVSIVTLTPISDDVPAIESLEAEAPVSEKLVAEIEPAVVPAPEDFAVAIKADATVAEAVTETKNVSSEEVIVEAFDVVMSDVAVMIAKNITEETVADHSPETAVKNDQTVTKPTESELPEPTDLIVEETVANSDAVNLHNAESKTIDSNFSESNDEEVPLDEKLLQTGEYDMLDVQSEVVTPGTVEPALNGGATCIPLPRNLASGTWQVIHSSGEFFRITVDRGENSSVKYGNDKGDVLETSFCVTTTPDGVRWCFIRSFVDSPAPIRRVTTEFFSPVQQ